MKPAEIRFVPLAAKTIVVHTVTYFIMGLLASTLLNYASWYAGPALSGLMRQLDDPLVMAGALFQPLRGLLFAVVFYVLREPLFGRANGWLIMWVMLVFVGILSTFGPAPGSIEGMVYTVLPFWDHFKGWPEVMGQALLFSLILTYWVTHPQTRWLTWLLVIAFIIALLLPLLGLLVTQGLPA